MDWIKLEQLAKRCWGVLKGPLGSERLWIRSRKDSRCACGRHSAQMPGLAARKPQSVDHSFDPRSRHHLRPCQPQARRFDIKCEMFNYLKDEAALM
ncbi:hypothetical protein RRG08_012105 [Elysia crispata]|uniref:Uncharacterized protein n=1 Tax=Elysia crispata TaxID=231223 RepID=A0AAE1ASV2_9GAST|nr:hypothetical protein RRG08_012105 [Elysia crispata]